MAIEMTSKVQPSERVAALIRGSQNPGITDDVKKAYFELLKIPPETLSGILRRTCVSEEVREAFSSRGVWALLDPQMQIRGPYDLTFTPQTLDALTHAMEREVRVQGPKAHAAKQGESSKRHVDHARRPGSSFRDGR